MPEIAPCVGIDVAMEKLDIHVQPTGVAFAVPNTAAGVRQLIARIEPGAVIALEASGGYERTAAEGLASAGFAVFRLHPADVRAFARMTGRRAKTDRIDAALNARAAPLAQASRMPYCARPVAADLKEMAACRRLLLDQLAALKGQATRLATQAMRRLLGTRIAALKADVRAIDQAMAQIIENDPDLRERARRIQTAPGAGPTLAATLIAYLPEIGALTSRQVASLVGVAPHPRQSGNQRTQGRCQAGRAPVRRVLYMATLAAIRSKTSNLRGFFERLRANGKPFKLAMVAAMRKLIVMLNAMIKTQQDWKPSTN